MLKRPVRMGHELKWFSPHRSRYRNSDVKSPSRMSLELKYRMLAHSTNARTHKRATFHRSFSSFSDDRTSTFCAASWGKSAGPGVSARCLRSRFWG
ncbi:hypothetical protein MTO96_043176 [Rhipicephalus appendiculatus]